MSTPTPTRITDGAERETAAGDAGTPASPLQIANRSGALGVVWAAIAWSAVALFFLFAMLLLTARYIVMPRADQWRPRIEQIASRSLSAPVSIGRIEVSWRGFNPQLSLTDVRISGRDGIGGLSLPSVDGTLSWLSALALEPRFSILRIQAPELDIARLPDDRFLIAGLIVDPRGKGEGPGLIDWILAQKQVVVRDARVRYSDDRRGAAVELTQVRLQLEKTPFGSHLFAMQALPHAAVAGPIDVRARIRHTPFVAASDYTRWSGEVFGEVGFADLATLSHIFGTTAKVQRAYGALRSWVSFDQKRLMRVVADVALTQVHITLADDLEPLALASVQGRVSQRRWGDDANGGQEFEAQRLVLVTEKDNAVAPLDAKLRTTRAKGNAAEHTQVQASRVDLKDFARLATHMPLARDLREWINRHAIDGTLHDATASWSGPRPEAKSLTLKTRFEGLVSAAQPAPSEERHMHSGAIGLPGFENLSGSIDVANGAGSMQLASKDVTLIFPGVFAEPRIRVGKLNAAINWKSDPLLEIRVASAAMANDDVEVEGSATYRATAGTPGWLDLNGRVTRLHAPAAFRYVPAVAGKGTIEWLQHALVAGRVTDGAFRVKGDLAQFPFPHQRDGEMRVTARVADASLDVHPARAERPSADAWPLLSGIDAEIVFDRASMTITAQQGQAFGIRLADVVARIPDLDHNPTLDVQGTATGPLLDMVRYVNASPVARWIGGVTDSAQASGDAKLELRLGIPLQHAVDSKVAGTVHFINNDVMLVDVPAFSRVTGTLVFTENSVRANLSASALGGQTKIEAVTSADGAVQFTTTGIATVPGIRRAITLGPVQQLLDRAQGSARYVATLTAGPAPQFRIESDLLGVAIEGIAPLSKTAQEPLPLRIERVVEGAHGERDELRVTAGKVLALRFERRREQNEYRVTRGVIALNEPANLPESGVLVLATMPRLDLEAWSAMLGSETGALKTGASSAVNVDLVAIRAQQLVIMGRTFHNVTLGATRTADSGFDANVVSDGVVGYIAWRPEQITARLSRLSLPAGRKGDVVDVLRSPPKHLPSLDIAAEQFELDAMKLGRLDLMAQNTGSASAPAWRVRRFDISNPDMKLTATGEWMPTVSTAARRMKMNFRLDARDAGATLDRLGFKGAMASGQGFFEGDVEWAGSPLDVDYPTLTGKLALSLDDGRFLRVDAGNAGRLLSLLSLQSLSRTLLFDAGQSFAEGFAYQSIRADATIAQGVISTSNFRMAGASAAALMSGTVDLRHETQQLHLIVLPQIDASTAALALGVANPIIGIGAFLAQYVLRNPLSKVFALEYDISGTWTSPVVVRRGKPIETTEQTR